MEKVKYQGPQPQIAAVPIGAVRAAPGLDVRPDAGAVGKYERLIWKRGNIVPVTATRAENGSLALASGHAAFSANQNSGAGEIPLIVAETRGDSDALLLMLDMAVTQPIDHLAVSSCLCRLVDEHLVPRREIAEALGKSLAWLSLAERVSRRLATDVKEMLSRGAICMRSAEEIAQLPAAVQKQFADKAVSQALNKEQVRRWVSLYVGRGHSRAARDAMLSDPLACLKSEQKKKAPQAGRALFSRAMQRCRAALHELARAIESLPDSAMDDACGQLRWLLDDVMGLSDRASDVFTRAKMGVGE